MVVCKLVFFLAVPLTGRAENAATGIEAGVCAVSRKFFDRFSWADTGATSIEYATIAGAMGLALAASMPLLKAAMTDAYAPLTAALEGTGNGFGVRMEKGGAAAHLPAAPRPPVRVAKVHQSPKITIEPARGEKRKAPPLVRGNIVTGSLRVPVARKRGARTSMNARSVNAHSPASFLRPSLGYDIGQ